MNNIQEYENLTLAEKVTFQRHEVIHLKDVLNSNKIKQKILLERIVELLTDAHVALNRTPAKVTAADFNIEYSIDKITKFLETL